MSLTYFPCLSIISNNRVIFSLCEIRSLQDYYEYQIANFINKGFHIGSRHADEGDGNSKPSEQNSSEIGVLTKVADYQVYHLYLYRISKEICLFLLVSITVGDNTLIEIMQDIYQTYLQCRNNPLSLTKPDSLLHSTTLYSAIFDLLYDAERKMTF
ncbi:uncharacterized protein [Blastocystis hominis]|uniref:Trafficking protein particle complex subunit n=1 Tax=Blastocystis hominis TaxID=12968 RepID=D8M1M8_BLAHO|nr:uncharacterized protein [Blastocystis hominis]CBK21967.2 unnamed protein product [Blastocystis hominis]|eukprot:XP_012896015.1 uncharacterized protein [Blastocystis hominis]